VTADKSPFFNELIEGKSTHRLCMDFSHPQGIREFMDKARAAGILPAGSEPLCIFAEGNSSVWLVGKRKQRLIMEV
jgi:hypothetical protein